MTIRCARPKTPLLKTVAHHCQSAPDAIKALIRKAAARTYDELWQVVGHVCTLFSDEESFNFFNAAGYGTD